MNLFGRYWKEKKPLSLMNRLSLLYLAFTLFIFAAVYLLVYLTGGTQNAYLHAMYIPIVLISSVFGVPGGIIIGVLAGIVLGPLMPHDTVNMVAQETINWVYRMGYFVGNGVLVGYIFKRYRQQYSIIHNLSTHSSETGLPNYQMYLSKYDDNEADTADVSLTLLINNYEEIVVLIGRHNYAKLCVEINDTFVNVIQTAEIYQIDPEKFWIELTHKSYTNHFEEILEVFEEKTFVINDVPLLVEFAFGVYFGKTEPLSRLEAFRASEIAALYAKNNIYRYSIYNSDFPYPHYQLGKLGAIPKAIKDNELYLEYHPIIDLKTNKVVAFEALVRWKKNGKVINPLDFIPIAEETKLIDSITEWIVNQVIEEYPMLTNNNDLLIYINISQRNLYNPRLIEDIIKRIKEENFKNNTIGVELTESTVMLDLKSSKGLLNSLKNEGIPLAIDDFGTGYSTLSSLSNLPIDRLKIDRGFIKKLLVENDTKTLIEMIVHYAHQLNVEVIAEGIETKEIEDILINMNCDFGQGFYYSRPMSAVEAKAFVAEYNQRK